MRPRGEQRDVGAFDEAPCASSPGSWYYLSPPGDDGAMIEAWSRSGGRVQQTVDYEHTLAAVRAFCDYCPDACKEACLQLREDDKVVGASSAAGVYGGTLFLDSGRKVTREALENKARKQQANARTAEAKRRARAALRARGGDEGTAA